MTDTVHVFREAHGRVEPVGKIVATRLAAAGDTPAFAGASFSYDTRYLESDLARPISCSLPLIEGPFDAEATRAFFDALLPGGRVRSALARSFGIPEDDYPRLLAHLGNETSGALIFADDANSLPGAERYDECRMSDFESFAMHPERLMLTYCRAGRTCLPGSATKYTVYTHDGDEWSLPKGRAISTHVVKAAHTGERDDQMLNEYLCLETARACGLAVVEASLVPIRAQEPLLLLRRYDRKMRKRTPDNADVGMAPLWSTARTRPVRLHQESISQALGSLAAQDGNARPAAAMRRLLDETSFNPLADRAGLLCRLVFDFLIGNCVDGVEKVSIVWDGKWERASLAPVYDACSTTVYADVPAVMGIGIGATSELDAVRRDDFGELAQDLGFARSYGAGVLDRIGSMLPGALEQAAARLGKLGLRRADALAERVREQTLQRLEQVGS